VTSNARRSFRLRILGILAVLVALNGVFVTALVWAYGTVIPGVVAGAMMWLLGGDASIDFGRLILSAPTLIALTAAFLIGQVWYGYTRLLSDVWEGTATPEEAPDLHAAVNRLAAMADVSAPAVAIVDADAPNCFTVGRAGNTTIVVTRPLLSALDGEQFDAVLAHEIAHVKNRDVTLMTITSLFIAVAEQAYRATRFLGRVHRSETKLSGNARLVHDWLLPVLFVSYVFVAPIMWLFPPLARQANESLARQREFAADAAAARITGRPVVLADALASLYEYEPAQPREDLRNSAEGMRALCFVPFGTVRDVDGGADAGDAGADQPSGDEADAGDPPAGDASSLANRVDEWLAARSPGERATAGTHPPVEERVQRLVDLSTADS
jgi:Zn-dependent protease with chaperone function